MRPGVLRLIKELKLKKNNVRIVIVSSNSEESLFTLFTKGLDMDPNSIFDLIAHGNLYKTKDHPPEIYEWSLEKLRIASTSLYCNRRFLKRFTISEKCKLKCFSNSFNLLEMKILVMLILLFLI